MSKQILKTSEEIYKKIEEIYKDEKGKKFITHLIKSFFPIDKAKYIFFKKDGMVCCISGIGLVSKEEVCQKMMETSADEFGEFFKSSLKIDTSKDGDDLKEEVVEHPVIKKLNGKVLGIESADSNKFICKDVHEQLYNFYANNLLSGDKHMSWVGKRMMADRVIDNMKSNKEISTTEEKVLNKQINKPHKVTLGDLNVLQKLKDKMEGK